MRVPQSERVLWTEWDGEAVREVVETTKLMTAYQRSKGRPPFSCATIVDGHAEDQQVVRSKSSNGQGGELVSLFVKGRHFSLSTSVTSQSYKFLAPEIRKNALSLLAWRTRTSSAST